MKRLGGLIIFIGGVVFMIMGIGMWRSPELDWEDFLDVWSLVISDIVRLTEDPFAVLGIVVLIVGLIIAFNGLKRLVRG